MGIIRTFFRDIFELFDLDVIFCKDCQREKQIRLSDVEDSIANLSAENVDFAYDFAKEFYEDEKERCSTIENKSQILLGATGITTTFIVGFIGLFAEYFVELSITLKWILIVIYFLIVISLFFTIMYSVQVLKVGKYFFYTPNIEDISKFKKKKVHKNKKGQVAVYMLSGIMNEKISNKKGGLLIKAQKHFRNSIILFLLLSIIIISFLAFNSNHQDNISTTQPPTISMIITKVN